jgi:hypothetical protein
MGAARSDSVREPGLNARFRQSQAPLEPVDKGALTTDMSVD